MNAGADIAVIGSCKRQWIGLRSARAIAALSGWRRGRVLVPCPTGCFLSCLRGACAWSVAGHSIEAGPGSGVAASARRHTTFDCGVPHGNQPHSGRSNASDVESSSWESTAHGSVSPAGVSMRQKLNDPLRAIARRHASTVAITSQCRGVRYSSGTIGRARYASARLTAMRRSPTLRRQRSITSFRNQGREGTTTPTASVPT